jgi:hypothetical protein
VVAAGTAGVIAALPLTGEMELDLAFCCTGCAPPIATAGDGDEELVAMGGDETAFLVAEAYDCADCDALVVF